jgi:hypothetical protein
MLGFDAVGRLALGQIGSSGATILTASVGAFTLTGNSALFASSMPSSAGSYSLSGIDVAFAVSGAAEAGSFAETGIDAVFVLSMPSDVASYILVGIDASLVSSAAVIVRRIIENGGMVLAFDSVSNLAITELPQVHEDGDTDDATRLPLYIRGASYWKGRA